MNHVHHGLVFIVFIFLTACGGGGGGGSPVDNLPTANAGIDQTVNEVTTVTLSGTGTDAEGGVTLSWVQATGTPVTLSDSTIPNPTFDAPNVPSDEVVSFILTVTDSAGQTVADTVSITIVNLDNILPVVDAGPDQTVNEGDMVTLAGSGSDADGPVTLSWSQTGGTSVTLSDSTIGNPTFTAPAVSSNEVLTFRLTVTDNVSAKVFDDVSITVNDTSPPPPPPPTQGYLFYSNSLNAIDPAAPTSPSLIEPTANLVQTSGGFSATAEIIRIGDVDVTTKVVTDEHNYAVIYPKTDGKIYKVSALSSSSLTPVQVSNETQADQICTGAIGGTAVHPDFSNADNSVYFYVLPGTDTSCETDDDVWKMVRLNMSDTDSPIAAKRVLQELYDETTGALNGWLAQDTLGTKELQRCNIDFTSCSKLMDVSNYVEWRLRTTFSTVLLEIDSKLYVYTESTNTLSPARYTLPTSTFISVPDTDGTTVYFANGKDLYQMPADGSGNATILKTETDDIQRVLTGNNTVVYQLTASGLGTEIKSVLKTGGTPVSLATVGTGEDLFLLYVIGDKVYYNNRTITFSPVYTIIPLQAGVINEDGTGGTEYTDAAWSGATLKTTYDADLAIRLGGYLEKTFLIEGYDLPGTSGGIAGATVKVVDAATATVGLTVGTIPDTDKTTSLTCYGYGDDILCQELIEFVPSQPANPFQTDVYYGNTTTANSLQRVTNTAGENEIPLF